MSELFPIMHTQDRDGTVSKIRTAGGVFAVVGLPWDMIAPHEVQAQKNHSQTLARLAERGGLSAGEAVAVLTGLTWHQIPRDDAECHRRLSMPLKTRRHLGEKAEI